MSEEQKNQEEAEEKGRCLAQEACEGAALKVSDLLNKKALAPCAEEQIAAQIQNNQELYTTLSRSLLELHNDMRAFREKEKNVDRMIFSLQQGVNKFSGDVNNRLKVLEENITKLTELWNSCVEETKKEE